MGLPGGSDGKASACNAGDLGSIPGLERFPGEGNGNPLQYSFLENSMDGGACVKRIALDPPALGSPDTTLSLDLSVGLGVRTLSAEFVFRCLLSWSPARWASSFRQSSITALFYFEDSRRIHARSTRVRKAVEEENCCFGTVDTWLLHKLTKGSEFATDFSNASTTGLFDPYEMCWSKIITSLLSIPLSLLPPVKDTSKESVDEQKDLIFVCLWQVADQQSAMFGECCFQTGDVKLTMGTGTFLDINTGNKPQQSVGGFYPLIGWKIGQEVVCLAEGNAGDTGTAIAWAQQLDLFTDAAETEKMAKSLEDSEGVYFVPSFSGLQAPLNDPCACASFMGLKPSTNKYHLVRAILESIAFRNKQLYEMMQKEIHIPVRKIRADGGVCKNSFVMQMTSDLINETIDRPVHVDMSCLGAASLAGLAVGFWSDKEELKKLRQSEMVFKPQKKWQEYEMNMGNWVKAVKRSMNWYKT
ncbi:hypothetical protein FD755_014565 [Muntiacus reevesi]|uniref:glycerol kinase n=1 Tax=Muntiacus reevesi TaxID=9886 RepID=A0A5N3XJK1_MUNRE|nr:hypothetical protein FD755_014565 [Muntiacus reevesi]